MTEAMRAHLRLLESNLPRRTHYRRDAPRKHGSPCLRPPDAIANQRRTFIAQNLHTMSTGRMAAELGISIISVRKHKRRILAGELKVQMGMALRGKK